MLVEIGIVVVLILAFTEVLGSISPKLREAYVNTLGVLIAIPILVILAAVALPVIAVGICVAFAIGILRAFYILTKPLVKRAPKAALFISVLSVTLLSIVVTWPVQKIGKVKTRIRESTSQYTPSNPLKEESQFSRQLLVEILAEGDRKLEFETIQQYQDAIERTKRSGGSQLTSGEGLLSITISGLLLTSQAYQVNLFETTIFGTEIGFLLQWGLILLAVLVVFRIAVINLLSFSEDESFSSLTEADVALNLQRGVSHVGRVNMNLFLISFVLSIADVNRDIIRESLIMVNEDESDLGDILQNARRMIDQD